MLPKEPALSTVPFLPAWAGI